MSQNEAILNYLKKGKSISPMKALKLFGCWSLSSRISDLIKQNHNIKSEFVRDKKANKTYAKYFMP